MEQLIKKIAAKAGITEAKATIATTAVISALKEKLPSNFHSYIDNAAEGIEFTDSLKQEASEAVDKIKDTTDQFVDEVKEKFQGLFGHKKK